MKTSEQTNTYQNDKTFENLSLKENKEDDCFIKDSLTSYLKQIGEFPTLTDEEEKALMYELKSGNKEARKKFIEHNLKLVISVAKRYRGCNISFLDIVSYGNEGLFEAINRYDIEKDCKFSTYAVPCIKSKIIRGIRESSRAIVPSFHISEEIYKYSKIYSYLLNKLGYEPTIEEIALELKVSVDEVKLLECLLKEDISLNEQIDDSDNEFEDLIIDKSVNIEEDVTSNIYFSKIMDFINNNLSEKEIDIIKKRFGFDGKDPMTYDEIAKIYGVTRERIRVIVESILNKLRKSKKFQKISGYKEDEYKKLK